MGLKRRKKSRLAQSRRQWGSFTIGTWSHIQTLLQLLAVMSSFAVAINDSSNVRRRKFPPISVENVALTAGTSGGFTVCGVDLNQSSWHMEEDARKTFVDRTFSNGVDVASKNVIVQETSDGCVYYGFKNVSHDLAGFYRIRDKRNELDVGAFLQVVSVIVPRLSSNSSESVAVKPAVGQFYLSYSGLMEHVPCPDHRVRCNCTESRYNTISVVECSVTGSIPRNELVGVVFDFVPCAGEY
jgi:hypothetical protein